LLDQNAKDNSPLTDDEVRAQVDTFMFEVRCLKLKLKFFNFLNILDIFGAKVFADADRCTHALI